MRYCRGIFLGAGLLSTLGCSGVENSNAVEEVESIHSGVSLKPASPNNRRGTVGKRLMIIGNMTDELVGGVTDDAIYADRIALDVGGAENMRVLVIGGASSTPSWFHAYLQTVLFTRGVPAQNVELARIASEDDPDTAEDESTWAAGAYDPLEVAKVRAANVVWFSGGDQNRLVALMLDSYGRDTPVQAAIKAKLKEHDLIVAGYSAGAAIMSDPMIGNGTSWAALTQPLDTTPQCEGDEQLCVARGLGYLPSRYGIIVDQHFTERGRFARLVRALAATDKLTGIGVAEYTGFYINLQTETAEVVGVPERGTVSIIGRDGARANRERLGPPFLGEDYAVSVLSVGDTYTLPSAGQAHGVAHHPDTTEIYQPFSGYYSDAPIFTDAFGNLVLVDKIATYFADGTPQPSGARVDAIGFRVNEGGQATGFMFRFTADKKSQVAWNFDSGYSMYNARLKISCVSGMFRGVGP